MILMDCNNATLGIILYYFKNVLNLIWIVGPILAIISLVINFTLLAKNPDDQKIPKKIRNSFIALVVLFMIPTIVNAFMLIANDSFEISACWRQNISKPSLSSRYINPYEDTNNSQSVINDPGKYEYGKKKSSSSGTSTESAAAYNPNGELAERIASAAEYYAWPEGTPKSKYCRFNGGGSTSQFMADYRKFWPSFKNSKDKSVAAGTCCCHFARTCVVKGLGKTFSFTLLPGASKDEYTREKMAKLGFTRITFDGKKSSLRRGDVLYYRNKGPGGHVWIYLGNGKAAEGAHDSGYGGRITRVSNSKLKTSNKEAYYIFRAVK